jgi:L-lactate dehydrogenase complex protein LldF
VTGYLDQKPERFRALAKAMLEDPHRQGAIDAATDRLRKGRESAWADLENTDALRDRAHAIRMEVIDNLDRYVDEFRRAVEAQGGLVHLAADDVDACAYVTDLCRRRRAKLAVKAKSMLSEEIRLNQSLEGAGVETIETDLGEYVNQLAREHPAHILAPALERTVDDVAELFSRHGERVEPTLEAVAEAASRRLRDAFLAADVGITGANFAVAATGSICLVTNEGNGGQVSSLPPVHVVLLGMERIVPTLPDLAVLLELLARSATGQPLSTYTRVLTGPRREGEEDGPEEMHVVIVDNGRTNLRRGRYREMLACIRCGACLNVCPIYRKAGGGAYGPVYSGPMGAVLVPLLAGLEHAASLPHASSLCGACTAACPVKIPLHELLLDLRRDLVGERVAPLTERLAFGLWSVAWSRPVLYRLSTGLARAFQPLAARLGPGKIWSRDRVLPQLGRRYRSR